MTEQKTELDLYVESKLVEKKNAWYYYNNKSIGNGKAKAEIKLKEMIASGEVPKLPEASKNTLKPLNGALSDNKNDKENLEEEESLEEIYGPLAKQLGDISSRKKGGRFKVFVFGVDSRLNNHETVKKCPYVFRWNSKKNNVRSGTTIYNDGWTVLSKKNIKANQRTGKAWLTVARDDSPDEDSYTVKDYILCYAEKAQFKLKKAKMVMENMVRTSNMADKRQEKSEQLAKMSTDNPEGSIQGYAASNKAEQSIAKEHLEKNKNYTSAEAQEHIDSLNQIGNNPDEIDAAVAKLSKMVNEGNVGKTVKATTPLTLDDI